MGTCADQIRYRYHLAVRELSDPSKHDCFATAGRGRYQDPSDESAILHLPSGEQNTVVKQRYGQEKSTSSSVVEYVLYSITTVFSFVCLFSGSGSRDCIHDRNATGMSPATIVGQKSFQSCRPAPRKNRSMRTPSCFLCNEKEKTENSKQNCNATRNSAKLVVS